MNHFYKANNQKATVCTKGTCITVYGKEAEYLKAVVLITVTVVALSWLAKALK